jgi:hypothetical protein
MDIFNHLRNEHELITNLMIRFEGMDGTNEERVRAFESIKSEVLSVSLAEARTLYADLVEIPALTAEVQLAKAAHARIEQLFEELGQFPEPGDPVWMAKFSVLRSEIERHFDDEKSRLVPLARRILDESDAAALGSAMERHEAKLRPPEPQALPS